MAERDRPTTTEPEIEITPAMMTAGAEVIRGHYCDHDFYCPPAAVAEAVFRAMAHASAKPSELGELSP